MDTAEPTRAEEVDVDDLVPLADRLRWMLTYRLAVVALLPVAAATQVLSGPVFGRPFLIGLAWLALTVLTVPARLLGRGVALTAFSCTLFGDGLLLGALRASSGWLGGPVELLVVGHVVAVTLLASFRTGARITMWHLAVCFVVLEARAAGLIGPAVAIDLRRFAAVMALLWLIMVATASFAAVNERELRRRRYDSERLRAFGAAVARCLDTGAVATLLAEFGRDELLARRAAVLFRGAGTAYLLDGTGGHDMPIPAGTSRRSPLRRAWETGRSVLAGRQAATNDPVLAALLPGAHSIIVVPFGADDTSGVLLLDYARWSSQRGSRRVELRVVGTAEQAAAQASLAAGRARLLAHARESAQTDGLTGLANRRAFDEHLAVDAARPPVALIMIDLDHFKRLNDTYGHQAGDGVLRMVAGILRQEAPPGALAARYGGEELALILPGADGATGYNVAERIRAAIATAGGPVPVTASLGVAAGPPDGGSPAELLAAADAALYQAKRDGRDRVARAGAVHAEAA
jgi:diguanylate cyclase (GGDEF)-like protein